MPNILSEVSKTEEVNIKSIKHVVLPVAQSRSLHVVHEAYLCKSCFRNAMNLEMVRLEEDQGEDDEGEISQIRNHQTQKEPLPAPN